MREGLHAYGSIDYSCFIRGGYNFYVVQAPTLQGKLPTPGEGPSVKWELEPDITPLLRELS